MFIFHAVDGLFKLKFSKFIFVLKCWPFLFIRSLFLRSDYTFILFLIIALSVLLC